MPTVSSTLIYIGNLADIDPDETNNTNENPNVLFQTFGHADLTVTTVVQDDINGDGTVQENDNGQTPDTFSYDVGAGPVTSGLDNAARYDVDYIDENGVTQSTVISAYQTENGDVFLRFPDGLKVSSVTVKSMVGDGFTGITHGASSSSEVVCFALGTLIETPDGLRAIETLRIGDLVTTLDHGPQAILWTHRAEHPLDAVEQDSLPVMIAADALGKGHPTQELIVSPQHRMFVGGSGQLNDLFKSEALAPAKSLTALRGIRVMKGKQHITWIHFACARHEVVSANGCLTEALLLGPMVVNGLKRLEQQELNAIYGAVPTPETALNGPPIRTCLKVGEVRRHIIKHQTEKKRCNAREIRKWDLDLAMEKWEEDRLNLRPSKYHHPNLRIAS